MDLLAGFVDGKLGLVSEQKESCNLLQCLKLICFELFSSSVLNINEFDL